MFRALAVIAFLLTGSEAMAQARCDACRLVNDPAAETPAVDPNRNSIVPLEVFTTLGVQLFGDAVAFGLVYGVIALGAQGASGIGGVVQVILAVIGGVIVGTAWLTLLPAVVALAAAWVATPPTQNSRFLPFAVTYSSLLVNFGVVALFSVVLNANPTAQILAMLLSTAIIRYVATPVLVSFLLHRDFGGAPAPVEQKKFDEPPPPPPATDYTPIRWVPKVDAYGRELPFGVPSST